MTPQKKRLFKEIVDNEIESFEYISVEWLKKWIEKKTPDQEIMKQLRSELLLGKTELLDELLKAIEE